MDLLQHARPLEPALRGQYEVRLVSDRSATTGSLAPQRLALMSTSPVHVGNVWAGTAGTLPLTSARLCADGKRSKEKFLVFE